MTPIDWSALTPREVWDALRTAPRVAGEWKENARHDVSGNEVAHVQNEAWRLNRPNPDRRCVAWNTRGAREEYIHEQAGIGPMMREKRGWTETESEARAACDAALRAEGWVLVEGEEG